MDQDGNGLDDEIEHQIALCFVPEFRYDDAENALRECEPVVGYTSFRIPGNAPDDILIRYKAVQLYRDDGGYAYDDSILCNAPNGDDAHAGDSQPFTIDVRVSPDSQSGAWRAQLSKFSLCPSGEMAGTHPVVYLAAGKHHEYCYSGVSEYERSGPNCDDGHRGNGAVRVPRFLFKAPLSLIFSTSPPTWPGPWANACEYVLSNGLHRVFADRLQPDDLGNLGFPSQFLIADYFYLSDPLHYFVGPFGPGVAPTDTDGDGLSELAHVLEGSEQVKILSVPADGCPLDSGPEIDADNDSLYGTCDPDANFRQKYVGIGTPQYPAVPPPEASWTSNSSTSPYSGFWDSDQDRLPNGLDQCPSINPVATGISFATGISNRWAEDVNWPPDPIANNELGFFQRGAVCDPYPVAASKWIPPNSYGSKCGPSGYVTVGHNFVALETSTFRGHSANDPYWDDPQVELPEVVAAQTYRCACRDHYTGQALTGAACLLDPDSDCFREKARPATRLDGAGRGWIPLHHRGCGSRGSTQYCGRTALAVPGHSSTSWDWYDETQSFGPWSVEPHFATDDLIFTDEVIEVNGEPLHQSYVEPTHEYALWTLLYIDEPPSFPIQRPESFFPDPEYDPLHRADDLLDVTSPSSLRLRSSFSESTIHPISIHKEMKPPIFCNLLTVDQLLHRLDLWFGPDPASPTLELLDDARLVLHDGRTLDRLALIRPAQGNYATIEIDLSSASGWIAESNVRVAAVSSFSGPSAGSLLVRQNAAEQFAAPVEPDLIVVQSGDGESVPGWARLVPVAASDATIRYEVAHEGTLRGSLSTGAQIVPDAEGSTAAVIDLPGGIVEAFVFGTEPPARHVLPPDLRGRSGVALALRGSNLLVSGGERTGELLGDLWLIDLFSGEYRSLRGDLPRRRDARLVVTPAGSHVLLVGGVDAANTHHDDAWLLADATHAPGVLAPLQLYADTTRANTFDARNRSMVFDPVMGRLLSFSFDPDADERIAPQTRTATGWENSTTRGEPHSCAADDPYGGRVCALSEAWWASVGRTPCGGQVDECEGTAGELIMTGNIQAPVVAADLDASGGANAWVLRPLALERHLVREDASTEFLASVRLPAKTRDLAVRNGIALVATERGVVLARATRGGLDVSDPLPVSGKPLRVVPLANNTWAVATTLGLAIVRSGIDVPLQTVAIVVLAQAPDELGAVTALATVGDTRVLLATGPVLFDLDLANLDAPVLTSALALPYPLRALRADAQGGRAYGVGPSDNQRLSFDLRGPMLSMLGSHAVGDWALRRDLGGFRLRIIASSADIARVVP